MKIKFFGYNTFLIESGNKKLTIDPGTLFFYWFRFTTLFPKSEWGNITHIFITHGGPDHYWHADRVAKTSNAPVICNKTMVRDMDGKALPSFAGDCTEARVEGSTADCSGLRGSG